MTHVSWYKNDPTFRKFEGDRRTYYVPVTEFINAGDNILVDTHDPKSAGFGGSTFRITTTEGKDDFVKGPWHGQVPYEVCNVTELHFTKVTIIANARHIPYDEWSNPLFNYPVNSIEYRFHIRGEILYDEKEWVLGHFYRGDRIAQQLADLRKEALFVNVESDGGSHSHDCEPGRQLHPLAERTAKVRTLTLNREQGGVVDY